MDTLLTHAVMKHDISCTTTLSMQTQSSIKALSHYSAGIKHKHLISL